MCGRERRRGGQRASGVRSHPEAETSERVAARSRVQSLVPADPAVDQFGYKIRGKGSARVINQYLESGIRL